MELTVWLGLLASALFISISPGPGAIFSISQGTQNGFKRALIAVAWFDEPDCFFAIWLRNSN